MVVALLVLRMSTLIAANRLLLLTTSVNWCEHIQSNEGSNVGQWNPQLPFPSTMFHGYLAHRGSQSQRRCIYWLYRFESAGASTLHTTLLFGFNPGDATETQGIGVWLTPPFDGPFCRPALACRHFDAQYTVYTRVMRQLMALTSLFIHYNCKVVEVNPTVSLDDTPWRQVSRSSLVPPDHVRRINMQKERGR